MAKLLCPSSDRPCPRCTHTTTPASQCVANILLWRAIADRVLVVHQPPPQPPPQQEPPRPVVAAFSSTSSQPSTGQNQSTAQYDFTRSVCEGLQVKFLTVVHSVRGLSQRRDIRRRFKRMLSPRSSSTSTGSQIQTHRFERGVTNSR